MIRHIFLTGSRGAGKSSLLRRLLPLFPGKPLYGFYTKKEPRSADGRHRIYIHPAGTAKRFLEDRNCLAVCSADNADIRPSVFETVGVALLSGIPPQSLVVMDELGRFESGAPHFCEKVLGLLDSDCLVLGVLQDAKTPFLETVKNHPRVEVYHVTEENRDALYETIRRNITESL